MTIIDTHAADKMRAAIEAGKLKAGSWGDGTHAVCMMSAMVRGARSKSDCVTAGWPEWLANLNVYLFDEDVGADDEEKARGEFALRIAELVQTPRDYDKARDFFLIRCLDDGEYSALKSLRLNPVDSDWWRDCEVAITRVTDLLRRRVSGEYVKKDLNAADAAAYAAADAADAAARAARAAAHAAADATYAARAAAHAAVYAAYAAARAAACAATRADLIAALEAAQIKGDE